MKNSFTYEILNNINDIMCYINDKYKKTLKHILFVEIINYK